MPPGEPVPGVLMNVFTTERDRYFTLLFNSARRCAPQQLTNRLTLTLNLTATYSRRRT